LSAILKFRAAGAAAVFLFGALALVPAPAVAWNCDQRFENLSGNGFNVWVGAFANCRGSDRQEIFYCAYRNITDKGDDPKCLQDKLWYLPATGGLIDQNYTPAAAAPTCDERFAYYEGSSYWLGAFAPCKQ